MPPQLNLVNVHFVFIYSLMWQWAAYTRAIIINLMNELIMNVFIYKKTTAQKLYIYIYIRTLEAHTHTALPIENI